MAAGYTPRAGDYVKASHPSYEGTITRATDVAVELTDPKGKVRWIGLLDWTFEEIDPPVETFRPGTFVRGRFGRDVYLVTNKGYVDMVTGRHERWNGEFTSLAFERVEYTEAPF